MTVPVSVDAEAGYGLDGAELAERLAAAGAAGCNIEDTVPARRAEPAGAPAAPPEPGEAPVRLLADVTRQAELIAALHEADPDLMINARADAFARGALPGASDAERLGEAVTRARAYLDAGTDCIYVIGVADEAPIRALVERIPGPVNVTYRPGAPPLARLAELGVGRVTFGPWLHDATVKTRESMAERLRAGENPSRGALRPVPRRPDTRPGRRGVRCQMPPSSRVRWARSSSSGTEGPTWSKPSPTVAFCRKRAWIPSRITASL